MMPKWLAMTRMCRVAQTQPDSECPGRGEGPDHFEAQQARGWGWTGFASGYRARYYWLGRDDGGGWDSGLAQLKKTGSSP